MTSDDYQREIICLCSCFSFSSKKYVIVLLKFYGFLVLSPTAVCLF